MMRVMFVHSVIGCFHGQNLGEEVGIAAGVPVESRGTGVEVGASLMKMEVGVGVAVDRVDVPVEVGVAPGEMEVGDGVLVGAAVVALAVPVAAASETTI